MFAAILTVLMAALNGTGAVSGVVTDTNGTAIANAPVYLELGLQGDLVSTRTDAQGRFSFEGVGAGTAGVFAWTEGRAFGGDTVTLGIGSEVRDVSIRLQPATTLQGRVVDFQSNALSGAHVTRVAVFDGDAKVGIPINNLSQAGIATPVSGEAGAFSVPHMPQNGKVALKVAHPNYAQAGLDDITVGGDPVEVALHKGVVVYGTVETRGGDGVAEAVIAFSSAHPPNDTSFTRTNFKGEFEIRLNPGVYLYRAEGSQFRSPAWQRLSIQGDAPVQTVTLKVARLGVIKGAVRDARTEQPVANAKLKLVAGGETATIFQTGPSGVFEVEAAAGMAEVLFDSAPGYLPPPRPGMRIEVNEGEDYELPTFWLAPIPDYRVSVFGPDNQPAPRTAIRLLRPEQIGWHTTGDDGTANLSLQRWPDRGPVTALAEDPARPLVALFALNQGDTDGASVQLFDTATVSGTVINHRNKKIPGALVGFYGVEDAGQEPILFWRCRTDKDGRFTWRGAVPHVPIKCIAYGAEPEDGGEAPQGESASVLLAPGDSKELGNVVVPEGESSPVLLGKEIDWRAMPHLAGPAPKAEDERPAVVLFCTAKEAPVVVEALDAIHKHGVMAQVACAVVVDGAYEGGPSPIPVMRGAAPGPAATYYLDARGDVALEAHGMPDFAAVRQLVVGASAR